MLKLGPANRGVTLIELAVTLTIVGLLLVAAGPSVVAWIHNTQVRNTATSIQAGLMRARNEALRRNQLIRFSLVSLTDTVVMDNTCALSDTGVSWVVSVNNPTSLCAAAPSETTDPMIVETQAGGVGGRNVVVAARLADDSAAANTVTFNGFGRVTDAAPIGFINVSNNVTGGDYRRLRVVIGSSGAVRMCDRDVSTASDTRACP
ncbi:GspH/FimT family pseudopilin [Piscinibacter sp.]|jgi:type IV fimbrial biogenesis protein FimT|uniref:GspH/FimT family pseudopilin n=1 Tax=Piscinibacter sp. TaxID=1903157 RepID=UPI003559DC2F